MLNKNVYCKKKVLGQVPALVSLVIRVKNIMQSVKFLLTVYLFIPLKQIDVIIKQLGSWDYITVWKV